MLLIREEETRNDLIINNILRIITRDSKELRSKQTSSTLVLYLGQDQKSAVFSQYKEPGRYEPTTNTFCEIPVVWVQNDTYIHLLIR